MTDSRPTADGFSAAGALGARASVAALLLGACLFGGGALVAQNSMAKVRSEPGPAAARAGSAVAWRPDLARAREESARTGKPVFWYVPTVPGSPMDRKPELDRYMLAGPFSWPETVALLDAHFVPLKAVPDAREAKARGLVRGKFIEPGFLVLDPDGSERLRCDRITTHAPDWWRARLAQAAGVEPRPRPEALAAALAAWGRGDDASAIATLEAAASGDDADVSASARFLLGALHRRARRFVEAAQAWDELVANAPQHMLAFKVAAEREGHGPFLRGFEVFRPLPDAVIVGATQSSQAPAGVYAADELVRRSVRFLVEQQDEDGMYRDSWYDFGGTDSLPNVHMAVTAIAGWALLEARGAVGEDLAGALGAALERIEACTRDEARIAEQDRDEIVWAHAYRLRFLCRWMAEDDEARSRLFDTAAALVGRLIELQEESGAWFHEYPNPFVAATVLLALHAARERGIEVPQDAVRAGVTALERCRAANGAFPYGFARRPPRNLDVVGAAGRMPLCELALLRWGRSDQERLAGALAAAFEHHDVLAAVRKYDDHADRHGYGGFFFWYDMRARGEAIAALADAELRERLLGKQRALVLDLPEIDGCFVDSHELGRCYGTAMALLCLLGR